MHASHVHVRTACWKEPSCSRAYAISKPLGRPPEAKCSHTRQGECWINCSELGKHVAACSIAWWRLAWWVEDALIEVWTASDGGVNISGTLLQISPGSWYVLGLYIPSTPICLDIQKWSKFGTVVTVGHYALWASKWLERVKSVRWAAKTERWVVRPRAGFVSRRGGRRPPSRATAGRLTVVWGAIWRVSLWSSS